MARHKRHALGMPASPRVRAILELVSELDDQERDELRGELEGAQTSSVEEWDRAWGDELGRRIGEIERGEVELLTKEEFFAKFTAE